MSFRLSSMNSLSAPLMSLKVAQSDRTVRPRFQNSDDAPSTRSSTPETPASWHPRPTLTRLGPTLVADHVVPNFNSFFLFGMVASNLFETIPSPSPLFIPPRPRREAIRSGLKAIRRMVSIIVFSFEHGLSNGLSSHFGKIIYLLERAIYTGSHDPGMRENKFSSLKSS